MNKSLEKGRRHRKTKKGVLTVIRNQQIQRKKYPVLYSLTEFHDRFLNDKKFIKIYNNWVKNGYQYYDKPSIDRIDPYKSYTFENIQVVTWRENRLKGNKEVAVKKQKQVIMYDMTGKKLREFKSLTEAGRVMNLLIGNISSACSGNYRHCGGYIWKYKHER